MFNIFIKTKYKKIEYLIKETKKFSQIYQTYSNEELKQQTSYLKNKLNNS